MKKKAKQRTQKQDEIYISACIIVRDGEQDMDWCLSGLEGEADELVVVDTGSKDRTKEIARQHGAKVYDFPWQDDFSAARNFAISKVCGRWILFLDSDERMTDSSRGKLRAILQAEDASGKPKDMLSLFRREVDEQGKPVNMPDNPAVRVLRRLPDLHYRDPIHEYLIHDDGKMPSSRDVPKAEILLWHRGYGPDRLPKKTERNRQMLELAEKQGGKLYVHYYLAGLYFTEGRYEDAYRESLESYLAHENPAVGPLDLWRNWQAAAEKLGDKARMYNLLRLSMLEAPGLPDTYVRLAVMEMNRGDFRKGREYLLEAKKRKASFAEDCPNDYDWFQESAQQQTEALLAECEKKIAEEDGASVPSETLTASGQNAAADNAAVSASVVEEEEPRTELLDLIPPDAHVVVEFGCGHGATGAAYLHRAPECRYYGVAGSAEEAQAAARVLTAATVGTTSSFDPAMLGLSQVDCFVYPPEVLAGLTKDVLQRHAACLPETGQLVFLLENPAYLRRTMAVLAGDAVPGTAAMTQARLAAMLREAGFSRNYFFARYDDADAALRKAPETQALIERVRAWQQVAGQTSQKTGADVWAKSYVVRTPKQPRRTIAVQSLLGEALVTARPRITEPSKFLETVPGFFARQSKNSISTTLAKSVDGSVVIRQRQGFVNFEEAQKVTAHLREQGHLIIYEMDDNPILWHQKNVASRYMDYRGAHAVQVSTPMLADIVRPYNPHVLVFENELMELPKARDYEAEAEKNKGRVNIFFGALNREKEWQEILPALNRAAKRYAGKIFFRVLADQASFDALETQDKEFVGDLKQYGGRYVPYDVYTETLHASDIALLPLQDTPFNRGKSDLKFIESAGYGAVVLASPTVYERTVVDGCTGCIYRSPREFEEKLAHLIEDAEGRHAIARAAYGYVRDHRLLSQHYMERYLAYQALSLRREELDAELEERLHQMEQQDKKE